MNDLSNARRVALVIGNGRYNDAARPTTRCAMPPPWRVCWKTSGFSVITGYDVGIEEMDRRISRFAAAIDGKDAALFY